MSSISSTSASQLFATQRPPSPPSGKNRLSSAISDELSSGAITSTDATALDAIDSGLKAGGTSDGSGTTSGTTSKTRLDPSEAKAKIDGLIADQVGAGTLTSDQAGTLKELFAQGGHKGGGHGGPGGVGGRPPGPPPSDGADASSATSGTDSAGASASASSTDDLLASFIQQLKSSQAGGTGYASSGSSRTGGTASAMLFDFES